MLTIDPVFNGARSTNGKAVPVVTEQIGDIVSYTQRAIGEMGIVVVILTPDLKLMDPKQGTDKGAPLYANVRIQVQVSEFYAINQAKTGTQIAAATIVSRIIELLHWKSHNVISGIHFRQQVIELVGVTLRAHADQRQALTYLLMFQANLTIQTI